MFLCIIFVIYHQVAHAQFDVLLRESLLNSMIEPSLNAY